MNFFFFFPGKAIANRQVLGRLSNNQSVGPMEMYANERCKSALCLFASATSRDHLPWWSLFPFERKEGSFESSTDRTSPVPKSSMN